MDNDYPYLHQFFEQRAYETPDNIAVQCENQEITYLELERKANQLAHRLQRLGIRKGDCVGILLPRSANDYLSMLAILKLGAAYVPLDPDYPAERINYILTDCDVKLLITTTEFLSKLASFPGQPFLLDKEQYNIGNEPASKINSIESELTADDLCYVIYTSGSTGKPKGVEITHRSACNYIQSALQIYALNSKDRVYQGFSIAFDASIEEIWLTLSIGATLIPAVAKALHAGAGLVEFLNENRITFLSCVPTLLAMLDPPITSLRLLVLGGEVCPPDLIARWSHPDLRIVNTYGPTEATVITTYSECVLNKLVTIGKPLPNYEVLILDSELQPVAEGEEGELFIAGMGLARGYVNRPDLVKSKFIYHPQFNNKRLYRTGDLGRMLANGEIQFTGRVDNQIKLRGFRVELTEIESVLMEYKDVANAVVSAQELTPGIQSLIAYLVPHNNTTINLEKLPEFLHKRLPEYMFPHLFEVIEQLPVLPSGKIDRKNLPKPHVHHEHVNGKYQAPRTELEKEIYAVWNELFNHDDISVTADFFYDLGGHSLLAAKTISKLRKNSKMNSISMVDLYENPTIEKLAQKFSNATEHVYTKTETAHKQISNWQYYLCGFGQLLGSVFQFAVKSWEFLLIYLTLSFFLIGKFSLLEGVLLIVLVLPILMFLFVVAAKWIILGRIKAGKYKLWGWYYFRWWLATRIQNSLFPVNYLVGSPLINLYYRLMGAKIGKNCYIASENINSFDLITIGNNTSIGVTASLAGYTVEDGWLIIGPISVGNHCYIGNRAVLNINTTMCDESLLEDMSMLPTNTIIPKGKQYEGSPARQVGENQVTNNRFNTSTRWENIKYSSLQYLGLFFITLVYYSTYVPAIYLVDYFYEQRDFDSAVFIAAPLGAILFILLFSASVIIIKRSLLRKLKPGTYKLKSLYFVRTWIIERLMASLEVHVLSDSLYFPILLRLLGADIGKRVESGELVNLQPDLLTMKDESFNASGICIALPRIYNGYATFTPVTIGHRTFIGNISLLPPGTNLGNQCLIGTLSTPPKGEAASQSGTSWFGSPAIFLPKREIVTDVSEEETYHPPLSMYLKRLSVEFIRIVLPTVFTFITLLGLFFSVDYLFKNFSLLMTFILFPAFDILIMLGMAGITISVKWFLLGKIQEQQKPLWSMFIWKLDIFEHLFNEFITPTIAKVILGTPFMASLYRLLGAKIGKRAFINTFLFAEHDLIDIGDNVACNECSVIQTHLFEDRIFKLANIKIKDGCNIGFDSVVLYNTVMEDHSTLGNLSLLMKGEHLPAYSRWEGIPAQAIKGKPFISSVGESVPDDEKVLQPINI